MGAKQRAPHSGPPPQSGCSSLDGVPPFVPLEETMGRRSRANSADNDVSSSPSMVDDHKDHSHLLEEDEEENPIIAATRKATARIKSRIPNKKFDGKKFVMGCMGFFFLVIIYESFFVDAEDRLIQPDFADKFLTWVELNPGWGLGAISLVIAAAVITLVPIGTPLTLGCGYIYRGVYGWKLGLFVATAVSMAGSCLGAVVCFLLGRYLMRETVQQWVRKYPLFDAINVAAKEQGFKIMAMLYLTPVIPLGLVSYMCGTTSMNVYAFAFAKIFALPLYLIYTFMGASAHSFVKRGAAASGDGGGSPGGMSASDQAKQLEENQFLLVSGLVLSIVMMTLISRHIKKELMKILDEQKKEKLGENEETTQHVGDDAEETGIELGLPTRRRGVKSEQVD